MASHGMVIREQWTGKDVEGSGRGLISVTILAFVYSD
jgi:hypothetical protein